MHANTLPPVPFITEPPAPDEPVPPVRNPPLHPHSVSAADALKMLTAGAPAPLQAPEARELVLIALMLDYENSKWVLEEVTPEQFVPFTPEKKIFDIILAIEKSGQSVGIPGVLDRWPEDSSTTKAQLTESFDKLRIEFDKGVDLRSAVDAIQHRHKANQVASVLKKGTNDLSVQGKEPTVIAVEIADALDGLTASTHLPTVTQQALNEATLASLTTEPLPVFSTGFMELDRRIGGLSPSRTYTIGARTGVGKSAFLLNLLCSLGRQNIPTGFISLEMDRVVMNKRLYGIAGGIEASHLKSPVKPEILDRLHAVIAQTNDWPFYWSDRRGMTLTELKSKLSQFSRLGCRVAFVDYIQRVVVESTDTRNLQVAQVAKTLSDLAERLKMAIVVATQLNREGARADTPPELHHISESTVIEESADVILLLSNKKKEDDSLGRNRPMVVNVAKNRHGFGGRFDMYYAGRQFKFSDQPFRVESLPTVIPARPSSVPCPDLHVPEVTSSCSP